MKFKKGKLKPKNKKTYKRRDCIYMRGKKDNSTNHNTVTSQSQIVNVDGGRAPGGSFIVPIVDLRYTIEEHLQSFSNDSRYSYLWNSWCVEKREYIRKLETTNNTFSDYSLHDESHSETIIVNIERMLGTERIASLSPSDAWLILQVAYTHDFGMCVTEKEKSEFLAGVTADKLHHIFSSQTIKDEYSSYIKDLLNNLRERDAYYPTRDRDMVRRAADYWSDNIAALLDDKGFRDTVFGEDFSLAAYFYHLIIQQAFREQHAAYSREVLLEERQSKVERDIIPGHMREAVAQIAYRHGGRPEVVLELKQEQSGFGSGDFMHPRFVAALLRIGDLLDMESTRFNPYMIKSLEKVPFDNLAYMLKDLSVSEILINQHNICVTSSFGTSAIKAFLLRHNHFGMSSNDLFNEKRLVSRAIKYMRGTMDYIEKNLTYFWQIWSDIAPSNFIGGLPAPKRLKIVHDHVAVDELDLDLRYEIDPGRAARIIEGAALYETPLVFFREIIQNSIDATLLAIYENNKEYFNKKRKDKKTIPFIEFLKHHSFSFDDFKIEINIEFEQTADDKNDPMIVSVTDKGIGITEERLKEMRHIGAVSRNPKWGKVISEMPEWLKPTSEFGIGMQSVFLLASNFVIQSRPRLSDSDKDVQHRIAFNSVKFGGDITRIPFKPKDKDPIEGWDDKNQNKYPFGTRLEIRPQQEELNEFYKKLKDFPFHGGRNHVYAPNMALTFKHQCLEYLQTQFISSIIPISIKVDSKTEYEIGTVPFAQAEPLSDANGKDLVRYKDGILYYWHEQNGIMFSFEPLMEGNAPLTRFFFRGIRFGGAVLDEKAKISGLNCDINILKGKANELLEISRDFVKKESLPSFYSNIEVALKSFFDIFISLVKTSGKELPDNLLNIFKRSPDFAKQVYTYMLAKRQNPSIQPTDEENDYEYLKVMADVCGGLINIALLDKKSELIAFIPEPMVMDSENIPSSFIDSADYASGDKIDLKPVLSDDKAVKVVKILRNDFPLMMGLKFNSIEALPIITTNDSSKSCVFIYSLLTDAEMLNRDLDETRMNESSYRAILQDIRREYRQRLNNKTVDGNYAPVFPALPKTIATKLEDLSDFDIIKQISFSSQPVDENTYCDERFTRFILSPFPVEILCSDVKIEGEELSKLSDYLKKGGGDSITGGVFEKHMSYYKQALSYIENQLKVVEKNNHNTVKILTKDEIITAWIDKYANFLLSYFW